MGQVQPTTYENQNQTQTQTPAQTQTPEGYGAGMQNNRVMMEHVDQPSRGYAYNSSVWMQPGMGY